MTDPNPEAAKAAHEAFWDSYQMAPSDYQINIALDAALEDYHRVAFAALPCQPDAARERVIELERELELMRRDYLAAAAHAESLGSVEERLPDGDDDTKPLWHAHARFGTPSSQSLNASQEGSEANSAVRSDERTGLHTRTTPLQNAAAPLDEALVARLTEIMIEVLEKPNSSDADAVRAILRACPPITARQRAIVEAACDHAPRPATMPHVRMGQPAPEGDTHIILDAEDYERWRLRWKRDRDEQDMALRDAVRETAATADELAFWRYQAIWVRAYLHDSMIAGMPIPEESAAWKRAALELEANRRDENRERVVLGQAKEYLGK